jgi:hypothetical protein
VALLLSDEEQGYRLWIEVDNAPAAGDLGYGEDHRAERMEKAAVAATDVFSRGIDVIRDAARTASHQLQSLKEEMRPDELAIEFGVELDGEVGGILVKASAGAHLMVSMTWKRINRD